MSIADFISVSITIQAAAAKAPSFDTPLALADTPYLGGRFYALSPAGLAQMTTDGFASSSRAFQMVSRMNGQVGGAGQVIVYGRTTSHTHSQTLIPLDISTGKVYAFDLTFQGVTKAISVTVQLGDALEDVIDDLVAAIGVISDLTVVDNATDFTLTSDIPGDFVQLDGTPAALSVQDTGADADVAAMLAEAQADPAIGPNFYGLLIDSFAEPEINLAAAFAEANEKLFVGQSIDSGILDSGVANDIASDLQSAGYNRSGVMFSRFMRGDAAAALIGLQLGKTPGASNWAGQTLAGVNVDILTEAEKTNADAKRALLYTQEGGLSFTRSGRAASGRAFDITHGADFLKADIEARMLTLYVNQERIPFNSTGLAQVEAALRGALSASESSGLIEPGFTVTLPALEDISQVDKGNRELNNVTFSAVLSGAVDSITVNGTLTL